MRLKMLCQEQLRLQKQSKTTAVAKQIQTSFFVFHKGKQLLTTYAEGSWFSGCMLPKAYLTTRDISYVYMVLTVV